MICPPENVLAVIVELISKFGYALRSELVVAENMPRARTVTDLLENASQVTANYSFDAVNAGRVTKVYGKVYEVTHTERPLRGSQQTDAVVGEFVRSVKQEGEFAVSRLCVGGT